MSLENPIKTKACDLCGKRNAKDIARTKVQCKTGYKYSFQICPTCFHNRVIPALMQMGAWPTITEVEE